MSTHRVSVVIPTFQRRESVRRALRALARQTIPAADYQVVVVIDGSDDGTREMLESFAAPYDLVAVWQENQGRAIACNTGVRAADGDLIVLLDDDMEASTGFLAGHLRAHPPGSRRGVVGAAPVVCGTTAPPIVQYHARGFNARQETLARPDHTLRFREAYTGNFSVRRDLVLTVGIFDPAFRVYGHEDYELALRLERAGVQLVFSADALAYQHYEKDFAGLARDCISRGRTAVVFATKHAEVRDTLKLATYGQGSRKWRTVRATLLALGRLVPATPGAVIAFVTWLERRRPARLDRYYFLALDYCFWVGAQAAQRERTNVLEPGAATEATPQESTSPGSLPPVLARGG